LEERQDGATPRQKREAKKEEEGGRAEVNYIVVSIILKLIF
jgi:hypothetical protein